MSSDPPNSTDHPPERDAGLHRTLDRIAVAIEKRNELAGKEGGSEKEKEEKLDDGGEQKGKGEEDKKDGGKEGGKDKEEGKGKKGGKAKRFFTSPLGVVLTLAVAAALVIGGLTLWHHLKTHETTNDAYTTGHVHQVSPRVNGSVIEVRIDDNQAVKGGDVLVRLDPRDYEVSLERAEANLEQAQAQVLQAQGGLAQAEAAVAHAKAQVSQARANVDQAAANFEVAGVNFGRNNSLFQKDLRAVAKQDVDTTKSILDAQKAALNAATASAEAAEANVKAAQATRDSKAADVASSKAMVNVDRANVDDAKLQLSYCSVLAPCDGRVSKKSVELGFRVSTGQQLLAVTENDVWVLANLKETQLQNVRVGQRVKIPVDAFKKHPFTGRVDSVQNGSGATYSLLPPDNATGNFTKIVQRVPVKITFDPDSIKGFENLIVPGLSCEPVIDLASTSDQGQYVEKNHVAPPENRNRP